MVISGHKAAGWEGAGPRATAGTLSPEKTPLAAIALGKPSQCQALRAQALTSTPHQARPLEGPQPQSHTDNYKYLQHPGEWEGSVNGRPAG